MTPRAGSLSSMTPKNPDNRPVFAALHVEQEQLFYFHPSESLIAAIVENAADLGGPEPIELLDDLIWYRVNRKFWERYDGMTPDALWWIEFGVVSRKIAPPEVKIATVKAQDICTSLRWVEFPAPNFSADHKECGGEGER